MSVWPQLLARIPSLASHSKSLTAQELIVKQLQESYIFRLEQGVDLDIKTVKILCGNLDSFCVIVRVVKSYCP